MPTYEYECTVCGYEFDEFQSMTDAPLARCPKCRGRLRRLISAGSGLIFRGSGFYATDYRKNSAPPATKSEPPVPDVAKDKPATPAKTE